MNVQILVKLHKVSKLRTVSSFSTTLFFVLFRFAFYSRTFQPTVRQTDDLLSHPQSETKPCASRRCVKDLIIAMDEACNKAKSTLCIPPLALTSIPCNINQAISKLQQILPTTTFLCKESKSNNIKYSWHPQLL